MKLGGEETIENYTRVLSARIHQAIFEIKKWYLPVKYIILSGKSYMLLAQSIDRDCGKIEEDSFNGIPLVVADIDNDFQVVSSPIYAATNERGISK